MANTSRTYLNTNAIMDNSIELNKIKTDGKVLSDNNYTTEEKEKLAGLNNKGIITELATAGNGYNVKLDWSVDPAKESTVDPAYRGQVNLGASCTTSNSWAYAEGSKNVSSGQASHAEGQATIASGQVSHAEGQATIASGLHSHTVIGGWVTYLRLTGDAGVTTYTCSNISEVNDDPESVPYILGPDDYGYIIDIDKTYNMSPIKITSVDMSTGAIEVESTLSADTALSDTECEVGATIAHGDYSFAARGIAAGSSAWVVNKGGFAKGNNSFVGGNRNSAYNDSEVAFGHYNKSSQSSDAAAASIATIGIGTDKDNRKNAVEIMQNGDAYMIGVGGYDGTNPDSAARVQDIITDCENITYSALVDKRNAGRLVPGKQYRITDYTCTTTTSGTKSAGHVFDIIVTADSESVLNEEARAIQHEGDTYFANSKLSAWKIWYSLDNDTNRFAWADSANGKGVIYRMIDEFNNDVPYDFKNIQFYRKWDETKQLWSTISSDNTGVPCYTFSSVGDSSTLEFSDMSLSIENTFSDNVITRYSDPVQSLNNICFFGTIELSNFIDACTEVTFGDRCYANTISNGAGLCIGNDCTFNSFGNSCEEITLMSMCSNNTFGAYCVGNTLGERCTSNSFGDYCGGNSLGDGCKGNSFGYGCGDNSFGGHCWGNSFGNNCGGNSFGDYTESNSFGNDCYDIKFASDKNATTKYSYYQKNHFGDGCEYIVFKGTETASDSAQIQNYNFAQGLQGTQDTYLTIDGVRNRTFETKVAKNSNGDLKIYCEADLIK